MVSFAPLWATGPVVATHAVVAMGMIATGAVQFALPKGSPAHRLIGRVFVVGLALVAASGLLIFELRWFGPFSPIHLLSIFTLVMLWRAVSFARKGQIADHRKAMILLYVLALIVTGLFTLIPGRTMYAVLFG